MLDYKSGCWISNKDIVYKFSIYIIEQCKSGCEKMRSSHVYRCAKEEEETKTLKITGDLQEYVNAAYDQSQRISKKLSDRQQLQWHENSVLYRELFKKLLDYVNLLYLSVLLLLVWRIKWNQSFGKDSNPKPRQLISRGTQRSLFCLGTKDPRKTSNIRWELLFLLFKTERFNRRITYYVNEPLLGCCGVQLTS